MPELPEVETVKRGLEPSFTHAKIINVKQNRPDLRFPFPENFQSLLTGREIIGLGRRAKYLLIYLDNEETIISHLGMSGSWRVENRTPGSYYHEKNKLAHMTILKWISEQKTASFYMPSIMIHAVSALCC